jgi:hypothetical protein
MAFPMSFDEFLSCGGMQSLERQVADEAIDWLRARAAEAMEWKLERLIAAAEEALHKASELEQMNAAVLAIREIGILTGLRVEQQEVKSQRIEDEFRRRQVSMSFESGLCVAIGEALPAEGALVGERFVLAVSEGL